MTRESRTSYGVLLLATTGELLLCHATGTRWWDIPKGAGNAGEGPLPAALRETREECGLQLLPTALRDLGRMAYRPQKGLHLFAVLSARIDTATCTCSSYFVDAKGRTRPEMDAFGWTAFDAVRTRCAPAMAAVLTQRISLDALLRELMVAPEPLSGGGGIAVRSVPWLN